MTCEHTGLKTARTLTVAALTLILGVAVTSLHAQGEADRGTLLPEDAVALMDITAKLQGMEAAMLDSDTSYLNARAAAEAAEKALTDHRAAFEA